MKYLKSNITIDASPFRNARGEDGGKLARRMECFNCGSVGHRVTECRQGGMKGVKREKAGSVASVAGGGWGKKAKREGFSGAGVTKNRGAGVGERRGGGAD